MSSTVATISNLSHSYKDNIALDNVSLNLPLGKMIGFIGPDGVGKSTLLGIIAGVKKIQKGDVEVLSGDIKNSKFRNNICPKIAYMPQGLGKNLYMSLSVYENMEFFSRLFGEDKKERESRIDNLLSSTGLLPFKNRPAGQLSGGMKQKLGLCCSLIHDPDLLILDEPTTGVDPLSRRQFWELIKNIKSNMPNMSVLIATAYMEEAQQYDEIIAMNNGKILTHTTPLELLEQTNSQNIDEAFIKLLPQEQQNNHKLLIVPPKETKDETLAIEATNLTMKFGDFTAVNNVSFQIQQGEIFGFLGSNGCGKTTTMKMLTGLLEPSQGQTKLFGKSIESNSLKIKKDVGYMTQNFSLYTELTVYQNLHLHAKLFHLEKTIFENRINEMLERFNLLKYKDNLASSLPLGIKQRLSLAVAVIHKPKILILDEPTSGVDPISRDNFWELLIELSRKDNVTIFISTHFMNEAQRCDRISLMHQGKVLASDSPKKLMEKQNQNNLEESFIKYIEDEINISHNKKTEKSTYSKTNKTNNSSSLSRILGYSYKESLELLRDPVRLVFALLGIVILMFVMGYGINMDVQDLKFSVLDQDNSPQSRKYIQNISGSRYFIKDSQLNSQSQLDNALKKGDISLAFIIPPSFGKDILKGYTPEVSVWIDGAMPFRAETIKGYVSGLHNSYIKEQYTTLGYDISTNPNIIVRYRYNQDFKSLNAMAPAVMPMLLIFIPSILMALSVVREKELGSITNFYATPVSRFEFLIGKQIPYVIISTISFLGLILLIIYLFDVPLKGNFFVLFFGAFLYIIVTTGIGFLMSSFAKTQIAALGSTAILTLIPTISFSGLKDPVSSLEGVGAFVAQIFPVTYFINISRGIFNKAVSFEGLYFEFIVLTISIVVITILSLLSLKKQEI